MTDQALCPRCGTARVGGTAFCGTCGLAYGATEASAPQASSAVLGWTPPPEGGLKRSVNTRKLIAIVAVAAVGLTALSYAVSPSRNVSPAIAPLASPPAQVAPNWSAIVAQLKTDFAPIVWDARYEDEFLVINVTDGTTEFGATRLACEEIQPFLVSKGQGDQSFALYHPDGEVIATSGKC